MESAWECLELRLKSFECVGVVRVLECLFLSRVEGEGCMLLRGGG